MKAAIVPWIANAKTTTSFESHSDLAMCHMSRYGLPREVAGAYQSAVISRIHQLVPIDLQFNQKYWYMEFIVPFHYQHMLVPDMY